MLWEFCHCLAPLWAHYLALPLFIISALVNPGQEVNKAQRPIMPALTACPLMAKCGGALEDRSRPEVTSIHKMEHAPTKGGGSRSSARFQAGDGVIDLC
jgi:hypothetical protein